MRKKTKRWIQTILVLILAAIVFIGIECLGRYVYPGAP